MKREQIITTINTMVNGKIPIISSTGLISRELFSHYDHDLNFYMVGSMGLASSIAFGLAVNSKLKVIAVEGDASLLMNLGTLPNIGYSKPRNLIHIILDNSAYASCSNEKSITQKIKLEKIAKSSGYNHIYRIKSIKSLKDNLKKSLKQIGPVFMLVEMDLEGRRDLPRPLDLPKITKDFIKQYRKITK